MTIEEVKSKIKRDLDLAIMRKHHLLISTLPRILKMLDNLEPSWHPYPKEVPLVSDVYRVTLDVSPFAITRDLYYNSVTGLWQLPRGGGELSVDVIAWMELPKPYKKESNNDH